MRKFTVNEVIEKMEQKRGVNDYDYSLITNYEGTHSKIPIIHKTCDKTFLMTPKNFLAGQNCSHCATNKLKTTDQFIKEAIEKHGETYGYDQANYVNNETKLKIWCKIHKEYFDQTPVIHLQGAGCRKCANDSMRKSTEQFIEDANKIHNNTYLYLFVEYEANDIKVQILCPQSGHGIFEQTPNSHLAGDGCSNCDKEKRIYTQERFIKESKLAHNNKYDYEEVIFVDILQKVKIKCPHHSYFWQRGYKHLLKKQGCPNCTTNISKTETEWLDSLNITDLQRNITLTLQDGSKVRPDGYDSLTNTIYEFYGDYYHGNPEKFDPDKINPQLKKTYKHLHNKTLERETKIKASGYNLMTIWENDYKKSTK